MGDIGRGLVAIGAGLAALTGMMTGIGQGYAAGKAVKLLDVILRLKIKSVLCSF